MRAHVVLVSLLLLGSAAASQARQNAPFTVGIVEASGNLVPVAEFDGNEWSSSWPADASLEDAPPPDPALENWTLWFENPGPIELDSRITYDWLERLSPSELRIRTTGLVESNSLCSENLALATDLEPAPDLIVCEFCCTPETKRGIATTGPSAPQPVERVDPGSEEGERIATLIAPWFDELESQAVEEALARGVDFVDGQLRGSGQPSSAAERAAFPIRIDRVSRVPMEGSTAIYYVEARRNYGTTATDAMPCPGYSYLRTWIRPAPTAGVRVVDEDLELFDCDMKGALYDSPLVFWPRDGSADVFFRRLGWESESYGVMTVSPSGVTERTLASFGL